MSNSLTALITRIHAAFPQRFLSQQLIPRRARLVDELLNRTSDENAAGRVGQNPPGELRASRFQLGGNMASVARHWEGSAYHGSRRNLRGFISAAGGVLEIGVGLDIDGLLIIKIGVGVGRRCHRKAQSRPAGGRDAEVPGQEPQDRD